MFPANQRYLVRISYNPHNFNHFASVLHIRFTLCFKLCFALCLTSGAPAKASILVWTSFRNPSAFERNLPRSSGLFQVFAGALCSSHSFHIRASHLFFTSMPHIRKTGNIVSSIGALAAISKDRAITSRVSRGSMMPSSQSRAEA